MRWRLQLIVLLWGFTGIMGKLISVEAFPLVFWRMLIAVVCIGILLKLTKISLGVSKTQLWQYLGVGAIIGLHWLAFFGAIKVSNVSVALSTLSTGALFTALLEPFFFKRKIYVYEIVLGLLVVACVGVIFSVSPQYGWGIFLGVVCSFLSGLFSILNALLQKNPQNLPRKMMFYEMLGGWLLVAVAMVFTGQIDLVLELQTADIGWLLILGGLLTAYPMIESVALMKYISPYTLLLTVNLEPVYGIVLAYLIFGESEQMSPIFYAAAGVMILVILANEWIKIQSKKKNPKGS